MNNAMKGVLLSGLVLPGLGQVVLRSYRRGFTLMLIVCAAVVTIVVKAVDRALAVLEKIVSEGGSPDLESISAAVSQAVTATDHVTVNLASLLIFVGWLAGMVDAYRTGKKMDMEKTMDPRPEGRSGGEFEV